MTACTLLHRQAGPEERAGLRLPGSTSTPAARAAAAASAAVMSEAVSYWGALLKEVCFLVLRPEKA